MSDFTDSSGADGGPLQGAPTAGEQGEAAFAAAKGVAQFNVTNSECSVVWAPGRFAGDAISLVRGLVGEALLAAVLPIS